MTQIRYPNELNSFMLRARFETATPGVYYTFTAAANTILTNENTIGDVRAFVKELDAAAGTYAVTHDGVANITLDGAPCFTESTNGSYVYYTVRGGLPDGKYLAVIQFKRKNGSGQWDPRLSTATLEFSIVNQVITFS
jgi:hypothetical protein